jgi:peptide/nickel transport system substrate-binding protein/oligopeptide transport system substrate-binding protein
MRRHREYLRTRVPAALGVAAALWLAALGASPAHARNGATPPHGGTIRIAYAGSFASFDPAQAFSQDWWVMMGTLYDGLYQSGRDGQPQLDLAAAPPTISADRTVWTFHLRHGVRFSNGQALTARDVAYSITRTLDPHLKPAASWGQPTDDIFQGSHAFVLGKAKSVSGIQVLDPYTIRFVLAHPVAIFPYILSESFNMVVPQSVATKEGADFGNHPVGSGPFLLQSWTKGSQAVFVRNPYYFRAGKPYVDKIVVGIGTAPNVIALKVEKGELDGFGDALDVATADLQQARADPRYRRYLLTTPYTYVYWLDVNVHVAPFDKLAMRQAVALAINRNRLVKLLGGYALPATQLYAPVYVQHDPALVTRPVYGYDMQKAAALVRASGYHGQPITVLYPNEASQEQSLALGVQQSLQQIGLNVSLRGTSYTSLNALQSSLTGHQLSLYVWSPDYPDAYDLYASEFTCSANAPGGVAAPHYCDPTADALVNRAEAMPLGAARDALIRQAQVRILQSAARIPLVFPTLIDMVSPRIGGFYYQPLFGWQFENYWIKP